MPASGHMDLLLISGKSEDVLTTAFYRDRPVHSQVLSREPKTTFETNMVRLEIG